MYPEMETMIADLSNWSDDNSVLLYINGGVYHCRVAFRGSIVIYTSENYIHAVEKAWRDVDAKRELKRIRQDYVDNAIHNCIARIIPDRQVEWDIEMIGAVRDTIEEYVVPKYITREYFYG